jgi:hypothetical protein
VLLFIHWLRLVHIFCGSGLKKHSVTFFVGRLVASKAPCVSDKSKEIQTYFVVLRVALCLFQNQWCTEKLGQVENIL